MLSETRVYLGIGSNIDRSKAISKALLLLEQVFGKLDISPTFESEAVGFSGDNFYNLVVSFTTHLSLTVMVKTYKKIEDQSGRNRSDPKFSARTLDIDPLIYGDLVCDTPVQLPRDEILKNAYVLWPLAIMAGDEKHPETGLSFSEHWKMYDKNQKLWQVDTDWD
ncbi:MAG: 2-amino-4-hydroxy-6-hydroxymethyldihydropteridine diphosphokinase [Gammaproteobacteria bacterium]|nr:MAG: 2-amino-4-hydroxy-6-hydroxymethyldihydropteridine diphosphokinase [Gammaproteobacteria bacterium]